MKRPLGDLVSARASSCASATDLDAVQYAEHGRPRLRRRDESRHQRGEAANQRTAGIAVGRSRQGEWEASTERSSGLRCQSEHWQPPRHSATARPRPCSQGNQELNAYPHAKQPHGGGSRSAKRPAQLSPGGDDPRNPEWLDKGKDIGPAPLSGRRASRLRASGGSKAMRWAAQNVVPRPGADRSVTSSTKALMIANRARTRQPAVVAGFSSCIPPSAAVWAGSVTDGGGRTGDRQPRRSRVTSTGRRAVVHGGGHG